MFLVFTITTILVHSYIFFITDIILILIFSQFFKLTTIQFYFNIFYWMKWQKSKIGVSSVFLRELCFIYFYILRLYKCRSVKSDCQRSIFFLLGSLELVHKRAGYTLYCISKTYLLFSGTMWFCLSSPRL